MIPNEPPESGGVRRRKRSAAQAERGRGDAVQRERALEVRPRGQPPGALVPVADDAEALDRHAREPRDAERLADDEIGPGERVVDVAVVERAVVDRGGAERIEDGLERLVVDGDELGRVLGDVPVARDDDGERLAHVARRAPLPPRSGGSASRSPPGTASTAGRRPSPVEHAEHAVDRERRGRVDRDVRVRELRADDRGVPGVRNRLEIVDEAPLAAEERLVLETLERAPDPHRVLRGDGHRRSIARRTVTQRRGIRRRAAASCSSLGRRPSSARNASSTARGLRA